MKITVRLRYLCATAFLASLLFCGCLKKDDGIMIIWTDQADFASYAELFNASQSRYRVVVEYKDNPSSALIHERERPDVVVGPWLKGEKTRSKLIPLDYLFTELRISSQPFYQPLLNLGNVNGRQYLLPVSFNLPALVFAADKKDLVKTDFSLSLDEVETLGKDFNIDKKGVYTRMGFSPRWDSDFLYITAQLFNVKFEEDKKLFSWNQKALSEAVDYLRTWTRTVNTSATAEDDFEFKYLYDPPNKLVSKGRNLFSLMTSDELFMLPSDKIRNIDFRWITKNDKTPVKDKIIYMGICRDARHLGAAEAFLAWFFQEKNQKAMLEWNRTMGTMDRDFGISGGFSALRPVNEKAFPLFYPSLLGHLPPRDNLAVPKILPNNWELYKEKIVIPYLVDATRAAPGKEADVESLDHRIADWIKTH
jgi:hypothetical protein